MSLVPMPVFWVYQNSEYADVLNIPGLYICLWFSICQGSEYTNILTMPGFEYASSAQCARVLNRPGLHRPDHAWRIPEYALLHLIMPGYVCICLNMPGYTYAGMAFVLHVPIAGIHLTLWNAIVKTFAHNYPSATLCWMLKEESFYSKNFFQIIEQHISHSCWK